MKKNVASQAVGVQMVTAADGTAFTAAVSVFVTVDNGTQGAGGGTAPAHEGNGYHSYTPTQAETNGDHVAFTFTGTGAIPATVQVYTEFPQTGDSFARLGAPAGASVSADILVIDNFVDDLETRLGTPSNLGSGATVAANLVDIEGQTDDIGIAGAGLTALPGVTVTTNNDKTGYALSATGSAALTEGYAADGATATLPQLLYLIVALLGEFAIAGTTLTAKKLDGATTAATFTLSDAANPTSITRAT